MLEFHGPNAGRAGLQGPVSISLPDGNAAPAGPRVLKKFTKLFGVLHCTLRRIAMVAMCGNRLRTIARNSNPDIRGIQIGNDHIGQGLAECAEAIQPTFLPLDSAKFVVQGVFRQFRAIILGVKPDTDGFHSPASGLYDRVIPPRLSFNGLGCFGS